jgi:hypothetical protein
LAFFSKIPRDTFLGKPSEGNCYVQVIVIVNEMMVEIGKTKERLNVFDLLRFRPVANCLDFVFGHGKSIGRKHIAVKIDL